MVKKILAEVCRLVESVENSDPDRAWKPPPLLEEELPRDVNNFCDILFYACAVFSAAVREVGLCGLCWHNFEHNRKSEHKGIMEHIEKKPEHNLLKIVLTQKVTTQLLYCIITTLSA